MYDYQFLVYNKFYCPQYKCTQNQFDSTNEHKLVLIVQMYLTSFDSTNVHKTRFTVQMNMNQFW